MLEARWFAFLCGQVFHAEWIAPQAGYVVGVDELGEDDGSSLGPEGVDETANGRDDCPPCGHFQRGALVEEAVLHVDDEQGGLAGNESVLLFDAAIYFCVVYVHGNPCMRWSFSLPSRGVPHAGRRGRRRLSPRGNTGSRRSRILRYPRPSSRDYG